LNPSLGEGDYREANMYLAEDRILCLGIFCQAESNYIMKYIPDAVARTDAVDNIIEFINQRRRWINSSWFALNYVLRNYAYHVEESSHSSCMKYFFLPFNMFMAYLGKVNMYIIMAIFLFVVSTISYQFIPATFRDYNGFLYALPWLFPMW
jgi:chitin synthase